MNTRKKLRGWLGVEVQQGPHQPNESDEEILNVLRRVDDEELPTSEIAEQLTVGSDQAHNRLKTLHEEGRVTKRRTGQTDMWGLASEEPNQPVNPQLGTIVVRSNQSKRIAAGLWYWAKVTTAVSFGVMLLAVSVAVSDLTTPIYSWELFLAAGYLLGMLAAAWAGAAGIFKIAGIMAPRAAERFLLERKY